MTVTGLLITAAEGPANPNLWNPTILGVLVTLSAIGLFCGSAYLLLATNLGGRLGFLVSFASLTGFMVLLSAHREKLLGRYARVRSLLSTWEG